MLVPIADENQSQLIEWVDFDTTCTPCGTGTPDELTVNPQNYGLTAIAGLMNNARRYYEGGDPAFGSSPIASDPYAGCRPYYVILLTDGDETCAGQADAEAAVASLRNTTVGGVSYDIQTFVIGFGITPGDPDTEALATEGGTDAPGTHRAFYATDETSLALAFSQIVASSQLVETCNGSDDDCDGLTDEGFTLYCDRPAGITTPELCSDPGDPCNGTDDNCFAGTSDEPVNACGSCGPAPTEVCNGTDDDCDGFVDEAPGDCGGCTPDPEVCDGVDNDCDDDVDEGLERPCGSDVGVCTPGTETCTAGSWGGCTGTGPSAEVCNGLDDDCDGVVDGMARTCDDPPAVGECVPGMQVCIGGSWGACTGGIGPSTEGCDGLDNDCDGTVDEGDPGGGAPCDSDCGAGLTACVGGSLVCTGGAGGMPEACNGIDDDCDGTVDEEQPSMGPCDEGGTLCIEGTLECVAGSYQCVGGVAPAPEVCDCSDNDCDDATDEGMLCPSGSSCLGGDLCRCARPCQDGEFPCPAGYVCVTPGDPPGSFCVPDACAGLTCEPTDDGALRTCVEGECVSLCDTITCPEGRVCQPTTGNCVADDCTSFPERCGDSQICVDGECVDDPCAGVSCGADAFCRDGECVGSCAGVECGPEERCTGGECVPDRCAGTACGDGEVCDPASGECVVDRCEAMSCPDGRVCDPARGGCVPDPCLRVECPGEQVCRDGDCWSPGAGGGVDAGLGNEGVWVSAHGSRGCACRAGSGADPGGGLLALLALLATAWWRRRRR
jgi:MYXO-CTERM domain-containing protein